MAAVTLRQCNTGGGDRRYFKEGGYEVRGCFSEVISE